MEHGSATAHVSPIPDNLLETLEIKEHSCHTLSLLHSSENSYIIHEQAVPLHLTHWLLLCLRAVELF